MAKTKRELAKADKALIRAIALDHEWQEILFLVRNGVPFDVAHSLSWQERYAFCIIFQRFDGAKFNFKTMEFEKSKD